MRIAFVNHSRRKVGGAEKYISVVLPAMARAGHEVAWVHESDVPADREPVPCPSDVPSWCISDLGITTSLRELARWKPDVVYSHGIADNTFHASLLQLAPSVLYVHNYFGTCISGTKLHQTTVPRVCDRTLGPACLLHYFPDHCGGRNPLTMLSNYRQQSGRLDLMRRYNALIANSGHIQRELSRHGLTSECVHPFTAETPNVGDAPPAFEDDPLRLIFAGRMTTLKGGEYLLRAAPDVQRRLGRRLHVTFAGDGPERSQWQQLAANLGNDHVTFDFPGWLSSSDLQRAISQSHLLVFPSIWPEPFGLSGPEAGLLGVPSVAFAVGGIPEWLHDGVNGHFAPAPPSVGSLADAITKALAGRAHYDTLRQRACCEAQRYSLDDHLAKLTAIFERCRA